MITPTATLQDLIFADSIESGNLSAWTTAVIKTNNLSVTTSAALIGTYGSRGNIANNNITKASHCIELAQHGGHAQRHALQ